MCDGLGVKHLQHYGDDFSSSGHLYIVRIPNASDEQRREIIVKMAERGIACNVHYKPLPMMTAYKNFGWNIKDFPNAYNLFENTITLPLHTLLSDEDIEYVIDTFSCIINGFNEIKTDLRKNSNTSAMFLFKAGYFVPIK